MKLSNFLSVLLTAVLLMLIFHSIVSTEDDDIWLLEDVDKFRVLLDVASDASQDEVLSYLRNELELFDDVIIVEENPRYVILFFANELMYSDGISSDAIAFSVLILETLNGPLMIQRLEADGPLSEKHKATLWEFARYGYHHVCDFYSCGGPKSGLKELCQGVIRDFNESYLEPRRKLLNMLRYLREQQESSN